jgi:hypothetical protein
MIMSIWRERGFMRLWPILFVLGLAVLIGGVVMVRRGAGSPHDAHAADERHGLFVFDTWSGIGLTSPIATGTNPLLRWATLEPADGVYDWSALDRALADAEATGKHIVLRIYTNMDRFGQGAPAWYFGLPGARSYFPTSSAQAANAPAPVPWDAAYIDRFGRFLRALGTRYDGHPAIEFIQTNAGGGVYGEMVMGGPPPGWTPDVQGESTRFWLDRWLEAFPSTPLALMVNEIGYGLGPDASAYAANRGVYLQQNSPWLSPKSVALFTANQNSTRIVLEAEDSGCRSATGWHFDNMMQTVFNYGFRIDYLILCVNSFTDHETAAKLQQIMARLR